ncbi:hypothetical protein LXL04_005178 [Taraxacum kok-saghyz]
MLVARLEKKQKVLPDCDTLNPNYLMQIKIGDGNLTRFLTDTWRNEGALASSFPRLFALESMKNITVNERLKTGIGGWQRRRHPRGGREEEELKKLREVIEGTTLTDAVDKWILPKALDNVYTTKWMRNQFMDQRYTGITSKNRWNKWIPKKTNIFKWRVLKRRIPVKTVLQKLGANINDLKCSRCSLEEESVDHIFINCALAKDLWNRMGTWWRIAIPDFNNLDNVTISALLKAIWDARNDRIFNNNSRSPDIIFRGVQDMAYNWLWIRIPKILVFEVMVGKMSAYDNIPGNTKKKFQTKQHLAKRKQESNPYHCDVVYHKDEDVFKNRVHKTEEEEESRHASQMFKERFIKLKKKKVDMPLKCSRNEFNDKIFLADDLQTAVVPRVGYKTKHVSKLYKFVE